MNELDRGVEALKAGHVGKAREIFERECFDHADSAAAGYLSMMYFKGILPADRDTAIAAARLLWAATRDERPSAAHRLGTQYLSSRDLQVRAEGRRLVQKAQEADYPYAHCVMGILHWQEKAYKQAADDFRRYPQIRQDRKALPMYADTLEKLGRALEAADLYGVMWDSFHQDGAADKARDLYLQAGRPDQALAYAGSGTKGLDAEQLLKLAAACRTASDRKRALDYYRQALDRGVRCRFQIASLLRELGQLREAYETDCAGVQEGETRCGAGVFRYLLTHAEDADVQREWPEDRVDSLALLVENGSLREDIEDIRPALGVRLAEIYFEGRGVARSLRDSARCASWAPNDPKSLFYMGYAADQNQYPLLSREEGVQYIQEAADRGVPEALVDIGDRWERSDMIPRAIVCYQTAYGKGYKPAAIRIGDLYRDGKVGLILGRIPDRKTAQEWYDRGR